MAEYTNNKKFFKFVPFGNAPLTAFSVCRAFAVVYYPPPYFGGHTLRLENAAKSTIADLGIIKRINL